VQNFHVDSIPLPELFRRADNELLFSVDNPADVVRDPSGGKRGVKAPLENDYVQFGTASFCLGGRAHPRGISADNNQSFFGHDSSSLKFLVIILNTPTKYSIQPVSDH
jgi:hypothetical protein